MNYWPRFVDRIDELSELMRIAERGFYPVLYVFGPEGCGKTRLVREFIEEIGDEYLTLYVDARGSGSLEDVIIPFKAVTNSLKATLSELGEPLGRAVSLMLPHIVKKIWELKIVGKRVVIVVDDVARPLGLDLIESYAKKLLDLLEWILSKGAKSALILVTTSEGKSRSILLKHNYVRIECLWNLSSEAAVELMSILGAPSNVHEKVWMLSGGNPRAIIELKWLDWNLNEWISRVKRRVASFIKTLSEDEKATLREVVDRPDLVESSPQLLDKLVDYNFIAPIDRPCLGYTPKPLAELGVGNDYAWQLPAYMQIVKELLD